MFVSTVVKQLARGLCFKLCIILLLRYLEQKAVKADNSIINQTDFLRMFFIILVFIPHITVDFVELVQK